MTMTKTATPAADIGLPEATAKDRRFAEFASILPRLSCESLRCLCVLGLALKLRADGKGSTRRSHVRERLAAVELAWCFSLHVERGKARRGELAHEDLAYLEGFGIAPEWILTGDIEALHQAGLRWARAA